MKRFFIVGCPRSGTTLLQQMLHAHGDIAVTPETHFVRHILNQWNGDPEAMLQAFMQHPGTRTSGVTEDALRGADGGAPGDAGALLRSFIAAYGALHDASVVGEKTPNHLLHMRRLEALVPDARFIHIVRDPRAVVASWRDVPWSTGSVRGDAAIWRYYERIAAQRPPQLAPLEVHYEDLVLDPSRTLTKVCDFLDVPLRDEMLHFDASPAQGVDVATEPWKRRAEGPLDPARLEAWREALTADDIRVIEAATAPFMSRRGYAPESPVAGRSLERLRHTAWRAWRLMGKARRR